MFPPIALPVSLLFLIYTRIPPASAQGDHQTSENTPDADTIQYGPFTHFRTEPNIFYNTLNITTFQGSRNETNQDWGGEYIFYCPRTLFSQKFGPTIIDPRNGELVWYGNNSVPGAATTGFAPCDFQSDTSKTHLCITRSQYVSINDTKTGLEVTQAVSINLVLTQHYEIVYNGGKEALAQEIERISDPSSTIKSWQGESSTTGPREAHEYHMLKGGKTYIAAIIRSRPWDLRKFAPPGLSQERALELQNGYVADACFQEISTSAPPGGNAIFTWCALDAYPDIDFWQPHVFFDGPDKTAEAKDEKYRDGAGGRGNRAWGWEVYHQNSVDIDGDGNYVVSARHLDAVFSVAGPQSATTDPRTGNPFEAGTVIWMLRGQSGGDFERVDASAEDSQNKVSEGERREWTFSRQHHAHVLGSMSNQTHLVMTLFDNGWTDRSNMTGTVSSGLVFALSRPTDWSTNIKGTATLLSRCIHPFARGDGVSAAKSGDDTGNSGRGTSISQGSTQVLSNGNILVGWGSAAEFTEFSSSCKPLWHARFGPAMNSRMQSYRVLRFDWVGKPKTKPKVATYRASCGTAQEETTAAFVSWNGATEVVSWKFWVYTSSNVKEKRWWPFSSHSFHWEEAGSTPKQGFETAFSFTKSTASLAVKVDALDSTGHILATSDAVQVFVPLDRLKAAGRCNSSHCTCSSTDVEGCTVSGPEKTFVYSMELSEACFSTELTAAIVEETSAGSKWSVSLPNLGLTLVALCFVVGATYMFFSGRAKSSALSQHDSLYNAAKGLITNTFDRIKERLEKPQRNEVYERIPLDENERREY